MKFSRSPIKHFLALFFTLLFLSAFTVASAEDLLSGSEPVYYDQVDSNGDFSGGQISTRSGTVGYSSISPIQLNAPVITVLDQGRPANRVDIVFLGDGYSSGSTNLFASDVALFSNSLFQELPLAMYQTYFNVHRVDIVSNDAGIDNDPGLGVESDTELDMGFWCQGIEEVLCLNVKKAWDYAALAPDFDQIITIANSDKFGGAAYPFSDLALIAGQPSVSVDNLLHQFGHSFANLADEYETGSWPEYTGFEPAEPNVSALTAAEMTSQRIKWYRWLGVDFGAPLGVIGTYEGAMQHQTKIYRPTLSSKMRSIKDPFNAPSIESFIIETYRVVDPIDDATPSQSGLTGDATLFVVPMEPVGHSLDIQWYLNGQAVAGANGDTFRADDYPLPDGQYEVLVKVVDNTALVRNEEARSALMTSTRSWSVDVDQFKPIIDGPEDQVVEVGQDAVFTVEAQGGGLSYQWYRDGQLVLGATGPELEILDASHADDASLVWVLISNLEGSTESRHAKLTVLNKAPILSPISLIEMGWKQTLKLNLLATDGDNDSLSFSCSPIFPDGVLPADISVNDNELTIAGKGTYVGTFQVNVSVSDGYDTSSQSVQVRLINSTPVLAPIDPLVQPWKTGAVSTAVSATDIDQDSLTYTAEIISESQFPVSVSISNGLLHVVPSQNFVGQFTVRVSVSDGYSSAFRDVVVNYYNRAPEFAGVEDLEVHWREVSKQIPLSCYDHDQDAVTLSAKIISQDAYSASVSLEVSDNVLSAQFPEQTLGTVQVEVSCNDGLATTVETFFIKVFNTPPSCFSLADLSTPWNRQLAPISLGLFDKDGEDVSVTVEARPSSIAWGIDSTIDAGKEQISWNRNLLGDDGIYFQGLQRNVLWPSLPETEDQWYQLLPNGELHMFPAYLGDNTLYRVLPSVYYKDPSLLFEVAHPAEISLPVTLNVENGFLNIAHDENFEGSFDVTVRLNDGLSVTQKNFMVTVYNEVLKLDSVGDQAMHWREDQIAIELSATDNDGERNLQAVEFSAEFVDTTPYYQLDQDYTFLGTEDAYYFNQFGLQEKHIRAEPNERIIILPDGKLYHWKGSLAESIWIANLPLAFYRNPSLLLEVPPPFVEAPASIEIRDQVLIINPTEGFTGYLFVKVSASNGIETDSEIIVVDVYNNLPNLNIDLNGEQYLSNPYTDDRFGSCRYSMIHSINWSGGDIRLNVSLSDLDNDPIELSAFSGYGYADQYARLLEEYQFVASEEVPGENYRGWMEWYFKGINNGEAADFAVRRNGNLYLWNGDFPSSELLLRKVPQFRWPCNSHEIGGIFDPTPPLLKTGQAEVFVNGDQVTIRPHPEQTEPFPVTLEAWDGKDVRHVVFYIHPFDTAPVLEEVENVRMHWRTDAVGVNLQASDEDGDPLTFSAEFFENTLAYKLDQKHDFTLLERGIFYNLEGRQGQYFQGTKNEENGYYWYVILPNGELYEYLGSFEDSVLLGTLPYAYYYNPRLLFDVLSPEVRLGTISTEGSRVTINPVNGFVGNFLIKASVTDGTFTDVGIFEVTVYNNEPQLGLIEDQAVSWKAGEHRVDLSGTDEDGADLPLNFTAKLGTVWNLLYELDQTHNFSFPSAHLDYNRFGWRERHFKGMVDGEETHYIILPSGALYLWNGDFATMEHLAWLPIPCYWSPWEMADVPPPPALPDVSVRTEGSQLIVQTPQDYIGKFQVLVTVDDGAASNRQWFTMDVKNFAPELEPIGPQRMHWRKDELRLPLSAVEYDGEPVIFSATALSGAPFEVEVSVEGNELILNPEPDVLGFFYVNVTASDGVNTDSERVAVEIYNTKPSLNTVGKQVINWTDCTRVIELEAVDADGDELTYAAEYMPGSATFVPFELLGNRLTLGPCGETLGYLRLLVSVSDRWASDGEVVEVIIENEKPTYQSIPTQTVHWREQKTVAIQASDKEEQSLTYTARAIHPGPGESDGADVSLSGNEITFGTKYPFKGWYSVAYTIADRFTSLQDGFYVVVTNTAPEIKEIEDQKLHWSETSFSMIVEASDPDGDPLTFSASIPDAAKRYASVSVSGSTLNFTFAGDDKYILPVSLSVSDQVDTTITNFNVLLGNNPPVIAPIPGRRVEQGTLSFDVDIPVSDLDGDEVTLNAEVLSASEAAYELDQLHNFALRYHDFNYNRLGNKEKYISGLSSGDGSLVEFVVYPNGQVYQWSGRLTESDFIGTLPIGYYEDPTLLFDVAAPEDQAPDAQVSVEGLRLSIFPSSGFRGDFVIWVKASDGLALDHAMFPVHVYEPVAAPVCDMQVRTHSGEYQGAGVIAFIAEGRIGDSPSNEITPTCELSVNQDGVSPDDGHGHGGDTGDGEGDADKDKCKITICHYPPGNPENAHTITIGCPAWKAHAAHGDTEGECLPQMTRSLTKHEHSEELHALETIDSSSADYVWQSHVDTPFTLVYNRDSGVAEFVIDGNSVFYQVSSTNPLSDVLITTRAEKSGSKITLSDLVLNGELIEQGLVSSDADGSVNTLEIFGTNINEGFTLDGVARLEFPIDHFKVNIVANGSFEEPAVFRSSGWDLYTNAEMPGWSVDWLNEQACQAGNPVTEPVIELQQGLLATPVEGEQYAELDSDCQGPGELGSGGPEQTTVVLWQDLDTIPGHEYEFSFFARRRPGEHGTQTLRVLWDGQELVSDVEASADWTEYVFTVTAESEISRIEFMDTGEANSFGIFLDDVKVVGQTLSDAPKNSELGFEIRLASVERDESYCQDPGIGEGGGVEQCGERPTLMSPTYTLWNSFLGMTNILELVNPSAEPLEITLSLYSILGELAHQETFTVGAFKQRDVILNSLPGFVNNSYGIVKLEFVGVMDGRMHYYRQAAQGVNYDFVFGYPLSDASSGLTAVSFNTFQPSFLADERENIVANWLNIVNLENEPKTFVVWTYNQLGELVLRRSIEVPAFGRVDVDGGHDLAGPSVVGTHVIEPEDQNGLYIAQLTRFGGNASAGFAPSEFRFAFPLVAKAASSEPVFAPISNRRGEDNWVEVVNIKDEPVRAYLNFFNAEGQLIESVDALLPANGQSHYNASALLEVGQVGFVSIEPTVANSVLAQSMYYFKEANGSVTAIYGSQARKGSRCQQSGSYNLFLGMENWLNVANTSHKEIEVKVTVNSSSGAIERLITIPARGTASLAIHNVNDFGAMPDTYGTLSVENTSGASTQIISELVRMRVLGEDVDFATPTAVRK